MMADQVKGDELLEALEKAVLAIIESKKTSTQERLVAIAHGTKLAAIRHKIVGREPDAEFFE